MKIYVPKHSAAKALGADEVAAAITAEAASRGLEIELIRNGSRGMIWLEPLVEIDRGAGREGYGPVSAADVPALLDGTLAGLGKVEEIPFFARQTRLTFARCGVTDPLCLDDYQAHGGLAGLRRAAAMSGAGIVEEVMQSELRGRGGAGDAGAIPLLTDLCETMTDGSLCALGGFTPYPVMSALTHFPDDFATAKEAAE